MFKTGLIKNIDAKKYRARVEFPELDGVLSNWLPIGVSFARKDKSYGLPSIDELVCCVMDENLEDGVILCALYNAEDTPNEENANVYQMKFEDGTVIQYDKAEHVLMANVQGDADITATGSIELTCVNAEINASAAITLNAPDVNIVGAIAHTGAQVTSGTITAQDCISDGKSGKYHVHGGVTAGGATTGAPQ